MNNTKKYILSQVASQNLTPDEAAIYLGEMNGPGHNGGKDIAIIGIAGRFGASSDLEEFWDFLEKGVNCIRKFPQCRLNDYKDMIRNPHYVEFTGCKSIKEEEIPKVHSLGGYMEEMDKFDAAFFGLPPMEAVNMDPYQRVALEVVWEALEDAGYGGDLMKGSRTGVYIGREYTNISYYKQLSEPDQMQLTGCWESMVASRISYLLDLKGPAMMIDTACSAGLVSVHLAVQSILAGESQMAIAGGINLTPGGENKPEYTLGASMENVVSHDGIVRTFDAKANGTLWGEGAGFVILKELEEALQNGDNIHGVIRGSGINNDGTSNSLTAPNAAQQENVICDTWKRAGIDAETITYVEAHGTGTMLGDPIEIKGLTNAFRQSTKKKQFCAIGSLKTNMGHMVAASGVASLLKIVKSMEKKQLAPTINFQQPNPYINFIESPLYVNDRLRFWETGGYPRRAAVSSFGFSRTNCHMVIEEAPVRKYAKSNKKYHCLTISAKKHEILLHYIKKYLLFIRKTELPLADICYTANVGRGHYPDRIAVIAESLTDLELKLNRIYEAGAEGFGGNGCFTGSFRVVSEQKKTLAAHELTARDQKNLSELASFKMKAYLSDNCINQELLESYCELYVKGAQPDWHLYYDGEQRNKVSVPVYPLERVRVWAKPKVSSLKFTYSPELHPLVHRKKQSDNESAVFETVFQVDRHWVLSDHRINHIAVLPGTTYLEMVRYGASIILGLSSMKIEDVFFLNPMVVETDREVETRMIFTKMQHQWSFEIKSQSGAEEWITHIEGKVSPCPGITGVAAADLNLVKNKAAGTEVDFAKESSSGVFQFGKHWDTVRTIWEDGDSTLAYLQVSDELKEELRTYGLHPSILDTAVNLTSQGRGKTYLPFRYKEIQYLRPLTGKMYSHIHLNRDKSRSGETKTYDIDLLDENGRLLVRISDYTVKQVHNPEDFNQSRSEQPLQMRWVPEEQQLSSDGPVETGRWAVLCIKGEKARDIEAYLKDHAKGYQLYFLDTDSQKEDTCQPDENGFAMIMEDFIRQGIDGIIFASDYTRSDRYDSVNDIKTFTDRRKTGVDALFYLCRQLLKTKMKPVNGIKVITGASRYADGSESSIDPLGAATAALAQVISQEYRHLNVSIADAVEEIEVGKVLDTIIRSDGGKIRALRQDGCYIPELDHIKMEIGRRIDLDEQGVYLITGGLGGLGLSIAEHLAEQGNARILLLGRREIPAEEQWDQRSKLYRRLSSLKKKAASLCYLQTDVSDPEEMKKLKEFIRAEYGKTAGIFHAAGVAGDGFLINKEFETYQQVMGPKLEGSWNLIALVEENPDAFMLLFSSITALTGGEGQCDYSAANAFLDALAELGRKSGIRIRAVNWPSWSETGMSLKYSLTESESLFSHITTKIGLAWIDAALSAKVWPQCIIPAGINPRIIAQVQAELPFRLSQNLITEVTAGQGDFKTDHNTGSDVVIHGIAEPNHIQRTLCNVFAAVLGLNEIDMFTSFQEMGGNSLMSTQLLKLIEKEFPGQIDISDIFSYPSVSELADYLERKTTDDSPASSIPEQEGMDADLLDLIRQELDGTDYLEAFIETGLKGGSL